MAHVARAATVTAPGTPAAAPEPIPAFVDARCHHRDCETKNAYRMIGSCYNCGTKPVLGLFTTGHEKRNGVLGEDCPVCGTRNLHWTRLATPDEIPADFEAKP